MAAREAFCALLAGSGADARASYEDLAKQLGGDARWAALERGERETEVRLFLQRAREKQRAAERARYASELEALHGVLDGLALEPTARWSEQEAAVTERFHGSAIAGKALRDLFYDYLEKLRERREKEQKQRQKEFRQRLFEVLEKLLNENRIRPEFHWEEVEAVMTDEEKPRFPDVKIAPQTVLSEFIDQVNSRVRLEEKVAIPRDCHVADAGAARGEAVPVDLPDDLRGVQRGGARAAGGAAGVGGGERQRGAVPAGLDAPRGEAARRGAVRLRVDAAQTAARGGGARELPGEEGVHGAAGRVSVRPGAPGVHLRGRGAAAEGEEALAGGRGRGRSRALVRRVLEGAARAAGEEGQGEGGQGEGEGKGQGEGEGEGEGEER